MIMIAINVGLGRKGEEGIHTRDINNSILSLVFEILPSCCPDVHSSLTSAILRQESSGGGDHGPGVLIGALWGACGRGMSKGRGKSQEGAIEGDKEEGNKQVLRNSLKR